MTFETWWDTVANTPAPDTFKKWEESCRQAWQAAQAQAAVEPVAYWIPKAEQFCFASPTGRPFAKAWEPLYASPPDHKPVSLQPVHDSITIDLLNDKVMRQQEAMRLALDKLWVLVEHNRLHFGDTHNTVAAGKAAIAALEGSLK